jgi:predicted nuclease of predicted toxin-antitoxin system
MRILFDHGTPSDIAKALSGHDIVEAIDRGWEQISNGELLAAAEEDGFDLLLTTDKNIRYQQNLTARKIGIVVLGNSTWRIVRLHLDRFRQIVNKTTPGNYVEIEIPFE